MPGERISRRPKSVSQGGELVVRGDIVCRIESIDVPVPFGRGERWRAEHKGKGSKIVSEKVIWKIPVWRFPPESVFSPEWMSGDPEITRLGPPLIPEGSRVGRLVEGIKKRVIPLMPPALVAAQIAAGIIPGPSAVVMPIENVLSKDQLRELAEIRQMTGQNEIERSFQSPRKERTPTPREIKGSSFENEGGTVEVAGLTMGEIVSTNDIGFKKDFAGRDGKGVLVMQDAGDTTFYLVPMMANGDLGIEVGGYIRYEDEDYSYAFRGNPQVVVGSDGFFYTICSVGPRREGLPLKDLLIQKLEVSANNELSVVNEREFERLEEVGFTPEDLVRSSSFSGESIALVGGARVGEVKKPYLFRINSDLELIRVLVQEENRFFSDKMVDLGDGSAFLICYGYTTTRYGTYEIATGEKVKGLIEVAGEKRTAGTAPYILENGNIFIVSGSSPRYTSVGTIVGVELDRNLEQVAEFELGVTGVYRPELVRVGRDEFMLFYGDSGMENFWGQRIFKDLDSGEWSFYEDAFIISGGDHVDDILSSFTSGLVEEGVGIGIWNKMIEGRGHGRARAMEIKTFANGEPLPVDTPTLEPSPTNEPTVVPPTPTLEPSPTVPPGGFKIHLPIVRN